MAIQWLVQLRDEINSAGVRNRTNEENCDYRGIAWSKETKAEIEKNQPEGQDK
jgi:hypothetical protein